MMRDLSPDAKREYKARSATAKAEFRKEWVAAKFETMKKEHTRVSEWKHAVTTDGTYEPFQ
eukprot:502669-Lingulodinium_polyedra.AAC.1